MAIIDIDCAELSGFDEEDQEHLEKFADLIASSCDFGHGLQSRMEKLEI